MNKHAINNGLIAGAIVSVILILLDLTAPRVIFDMKLNYLGFPIVFILFMVRSGLATRKDNEGILTFGQGFSNTMFVAAIATLIVTVFTFILVKYIDPSLIEIQKEVARELSLSMMEALNAPEEEIEKAIDKIDETDMNPSLGTVFLGWVGHLFCGAITALVIAAVIKKNEVYN